MVIKEKIHNFALWKCDNVFHYVIDYVPLKQKNL